MYFLFLILDIAIVVGIYILIACLKKRFRPKQDDILEHIKKPDMEVFHDPSDKLMNNNQQRLEKEQWAKMRNTEEIDDNTKDQIIKKLAPKGIPNSTDDLRSAMQNGYSVYDDLAYIITKKCDEIGQEKYYRNDDEEDLAMQSVRSFEHSGLDMHNGTDNTDCFR